MASPLDWINDELARLDREHLRRQLTVRDGPQGASITANGRRLINFGANDYLGLAADPRLADAAKRAIDEEGWGAGASPLITGHARAYERLERRLAELEATEAALVFPSGFAANTGTVAALVERGDAIFADAKNHASLIDGCRLSRADVHVYRHADASDLARMLDEKSGCRRRLIVTDTLFSMDGDLAPLVQIAELAELHGCMVVVDEAHATGVFGSHGRGLCEHLGVEDRIHVRVGTLSKALSCSGGFVAGSRALIDWLINRARPYVFSTAHPAANAVAALAALEIVASEPVRREALLGRAAFLRESLTAAGWNVGRSQSQIIPVYVGDPARTMELAGKLHDRGFLVPGIRPPSVPPGESLLRISLSYGHTDAMIHQLIGAMANLSNFIRR